MYHIPEEFFTDNKQYIHVTPGSEKDIHEALCATGHRVYYDFVAFCTKWNRRNSYVLCYYVKRERTVHVEADAAVEHDSTIYEPEDLIEYETDLHEILQLL